MNTQAYKSLGLCVDAAGHRFTFSAHRPEPFCERCGLVARAQASPASSPGIGSDRGFPYETSR